MIVFKKFWAEWCSPCKMLNPVVDELKSQYPNVQFVSINVDTESQETVKYGIRSIPAVVIEKDGQLVQNITGAQPKSVYENILNAL